MLCPFCRLSIHIEFSVDARQWVAMRDGAEHLCADLAQAMSEPRAADDNGGLSKQQPLPKQQPSMTAEAAKKRRGGSRQAPVQLELQALD
jgi:hypothetical protein